MYLTNLRAFIFKSFKPIAKRVVRKYQQKSWPKISCINAFAVKLPAKFEAGIKKKKRFFFPLGCTLIYKLIIK